MGERIRAGVVLGCVALTHMALAGAGSMARAEDEGGRELQELMTDAQRGVADAEYRLGKHYEAQYGLDLSDPDAAGDHTNLLLAFAWFQSAEKAGHPDARYARIATEYALRKVYDADEFRQAMDSVEAWMKDHSLADAPPPEAPSAAQPVADLPIDDAAEAPPEASTEVAPAAAPTEETSPEAATEVAPPAVAREEAPAEASTELAAGAEEGDSEPVTNPSSGDTADPVDDAPLQTANVPPTAGPDVEGLLARGNTYLEAGDLVSARGFFKLAAQRGSGTAAMLMGMTYDPGYLELTKVVGLRPNPRQAEAWYLKAIEMDNEEAESRLRTLRRRLDQDPR